MVDNYDTFLASLREGDYVDPARRAVAIAFHVKHWAAAMREDALEFHAEHGKEWGDISGDYVSDLHAALTHRLEWLSALVAELDSARVELDAASFPPAVA